MERLARIGMAGLVVCGLAGLPGAAVAQTGQYITSDQLQGAQEEISSLSNNLTSRITAAQSALETVRTMDETSEQEALISQQFDAIEKEVRAVLGKVSLNSPFMDALDDARAKTIVLKRWFERQPADYPDRDTSIARLEKAIQDYQAQTDDINQTSEQALGALTQLGVTRGVVIQQLKIGKIETSIKRLAELTEALGALSSKLSHIATRQQPDAPTVPQQ